MRCTFAGGMLAHRCCMRDAMLAGARGGGRRRITTTAAPLRAAAACCGANSPQAKTYMIIHHPPTAELLLPNNWEAAAWLGAGALSFYFIFCHARAQVYGRQRVDQRHRHTVRREHADVGSLPAAGHHPADSHRQSNRLPACFAGASSFVRLGFARDVRVRFKHEQRERSAFVRAGQLPRR